MRGWSRAGSTLLGAGIAGFLLWLADQWSHGTTGGYWAAYGVVAGAGLVFALSQLRGRDGNPGATFLLAFIPVLIVAGWVLVGWQPQSNTYRDHVLAWSGDMHIRGVVHDLATWLGVLAFGIGAVFGVALEPRTLRRRREGVAERPAPAPAAVPVVTHDTRAADEPVTAERHEVGEEEAVARRSRARTRVGWK